MIDLSNITCDKSWQNLACAIIKSGYKANDTRFLESDWCDTLKYFVSLKLHGYDGNCYVDTKSSFK